MNKYLYGSTTVKNNTVLLLSLISLIFVTFLLGGCQENRNLFNNRMLDFPLNFSVERSSTLNTNRQNTSAWTTMNPNLLFSSSHCYQNTTENYLRSNWPSTPMATGYTSQSDIMTYEESLRLRQIDNGWSRPRNVLYRDVRGYRQVREKR